MTLLEFDEEVKRSASLDVLGVEPTETVIIMRVRHLKPNRSEGHVTDVPIEALRRMPRNLLEGWLLGRPVLVHVSRIVGYFSTVHNWNPSKKAELVARQAGNYSFNGN